MSRNDAVLEQALALSRRLLDAADHGDLASLTKLDGERLQLLKSLKLESKPVGARDRAMLDEISRLNDAALGLVEHHRRSKGRALDMAAVGRRALAAYSTTQQR